MTLTTASGILRAVACGIAIICTLAACDGERVNITGTIGAPRPGSGATAGGGGSTTIDSRLVGQWSRTVLFQDNFGAVHASRTTWRFASNASASRAVVASNLTFGMVDSVVTAARWRTAGGSVVVTYLPEGSGTATFEYFFQGSALILGGITFERQ